MDQVEHARQEFQTSREAERMLSDLRQASAYCIGPNSSRQMGERIRAVEQVAKELKEKGR